MTKYEFDFSNVDEITVEAESESGAIEALLGTIEQRAKATAIPMTALKTYKVKNMGSGCYYYVQARSRGQASDILRDYLSERRSDALEDVQHGTPAHDLLIDYNLACKVEAEVDDDPEIDVEGNRVL